MTCMLFQLLSNAHQGNQLEAGPHAVQGSSFLTIATGYMNLTRTYNKLLLRSQLPVQLLAGSREANGWWGATGGGRHVPELYAAAAQSVVAIVSTLLWEARLTDI
jgi:hypothetical protein